MTLGDNQPPLTRREARELARRLQQVNPSDERADDQATEQDDAPVPAASHAPAEAAGAAAPSGEASDEQHSTLSRRELRSLMAARAAAAHQNAPRPEAAADRAATFDDREDDGIDDAVEPDAVEMVEIELDTDSVSYGGAQKLNPPVGHWSVARDIDEGIAVSDEYQPLDQLMGRGVAAGGVPTTTNALILPSIPQQGTGSQPLTSTGEVLITGSIDLPRSLGSTGQHPNTFDSSDMDHMLDQLDEGAPTSSVAPVSASKAVSSHASTRGVMTPPKKHAISLPTVLSITAAVLAIGVVALLVGGLVFNIF